MKLSSSPARAKTWLSALAGLLLWGGPGFADQVECENGDKYNGKVLSMDATRIKFESEVTGLMEIPRSKVALISFRAKKEAPSARPSAETAAPAPAKPVQKTNPLGGGIDPSAVEKVQQEFLSAAGPEANAMFNDMLKGLASGTLSIGDIRAQAKQSLKELEAMEKELGEEEDNPLLGGYVGILKSFLKQTEKEDKAAGSAKPFLKPRTLPATPEE